MLPSTNCSVKFFEPIVMVPLPAAPSIGLMRLSAYLPSPEPELEAPEPPPESDSESPQPTSSISTAARMPSRILGWSFMRFRYSLRGWRDEGHGPEGRYDAPA